MIPFRKVLILKNYERGLQMSTLQERVSLKTKVSNESWFSPWDGPEKEEEALHFLRELIARKYKEFQEEFCILHNSVSCWLQEPMEKSARISTSPKGTMIDDLAVFISQLFLSMVFRSHCFTFSFFLVLPLQLFPLLTPHSPMPIQLCQPFILLPFIISWLPFPFTSYLNS